MGRCIHVGAEKSIRVWDMLVSTISSWMVSGVIDTLTKSNTVDTHIGKLSIATLRKPPAVSDTSNQTGDIDGFSIKRNWWKYNGHSIPTLLASLMSHSLIPGMAKLRWRYPTIRD